MAVNATAHGTLNGCVHHTKGDTMKRLPVILVLGLAAAFANSASADEFGRHPFYLHAISNLRAAAWQVDHRRPDDPHMSRDEMIVRDEINAAVGDLERAAWLDGKPMQWNPPADGFMRPEGRLHAAIDLLRKAHFDVAREEDDPRSRGPQQRGMAHIDAALDAARHAVGDARRDEWRRE